MTSQGHRRHTQIPPIYHISLHSTLWVLFYCLWVFISGGFAVITIDSLYFKSHCCLNNHCSRCVIQGHKDPSHQSPPFPSIPKGYSPTKGLPIFLSYLMLSIILSQSSRNLTGCIASSFIVALSFLPLLNGLRKTCFEIGLQGMQNFWRAMARVFCRKPRPKRRWLVARTKPPRKCWRKTKTILRTRTRGGGPPPEETKI